ncbi:MAG: alpha/beta hydrolase family protein [Blastocatellales bacterium]
MKWSIRITTSLLILTGAVVIAAAQNKNSSSPTPAAAPSAFESKEVKFDGASVSLAGTFLVPKLEAGKRAPAVLIIAGSGPTPRDGMTFGTAKQLIYRDLAEYLSARGYVTLRYDKRCVGASQCVKPTSFDDFVDDAKGAVDYLREHPQVDAKRIFLFGHSEGGLIAAIIGANDDGALAGIILAAMPGRTLTKLMREQLQNRMTEAGKPQTEISGFLAKYDRVTRGLMSGHTNFSRENLNEKDPYEALLIGLIKQYEVVVALLVNDPLQIVNNIKFPVLAVQGKKDIQVAVKDAQFLEEAWKRAQHRDATVVVLDDVDHLLKTNKGVAGLASYADASRPLDANLLAVLTDWMQKKSK